MKIEELEVVTEDVNQEDRYSLASSLTKSVARSSGLTKSASLPMQREAFAALYKTILTE